MSDHIEHACRKCGSLVHHVDQCPTTQRQMKDMLDEARNTEAYRTEAAVLEATDPLHRRIQELEQQVENLKKDRNNWNVS